jgi:hypothetical protein
MNTISEQQYTTVKQPYREIYVKLELLNYHYEVVDEISGVALQHSWTCSATSDIRRTGTLLIKPDSEQAYKIQAGSKIWMDKYIRAYIGLKDMRTDEIIYNNMGIYMVNNPHQTFDSTTHTINLQLVDLMAKLTGMRNGSLNGYPHQFTDGQEVWDIIHSVLEACNLSYFDGYTQFVFTPLDQPETLQMDIKIEGTGTYYDILKKILEMQYVNFQMYFDINGKFHFEPIPDIVAKQGEEPTIMADDDIWHQCYVSHEVQTDYQSVKNHIIVVGKTQTGQKLLTNPQASTVTNEQYILEGTNTSIRRVQNHLKVSMTTPESVWGSHAQMFPNHRLQLKINGYNNLNFQYPVKMSDEDGKYIRFNANTYYIFKLQNIIVETVQITGDANSKTFTLSKPLNSTGDIIDGMMAPEYTHKQTYISLSAKTLAEAQAENCKVNATNVGTYTTIWTSKALSNTALNNRIAYLWCYVENKTPYWDFIGELQPRGEVKDELETSPFYVNGTVGDIPIVLSGGDYDNIPTSELAEERAKWELYRRCRLNDNITITCLPIYWLDVNEIIKITFPNEDEPKLYMVKEISTDGNLGGVQQITAVSYYPFYEQ